MPCGLECGNCLTVAHVTLDLGQLGCCSSRPLGPSALPILRSGGFFFCLLSGFFPFLDGRNPEFVSGFQIARCQVLLGKTCFKQKSRKTIADLSNQEPQEISLHHQQEPSYWKGSARWPININPVSMLVFLQHRTIPAYQRNSVPAQSISIQNKNWFPTFAWQTDL